MKEKKRLHLSLGYVEAQQLDQLCTHFRETPTPTIKRCINEMHSKHEKDLKKTQKDNA